MTGTGSGAATPVSGHSGRSGQGAQISLAVNSVSLESISKAFKAMTKKEPLTIPEPVGQAIRFLAHETLEGLPDGEGFPVQ